MPNDGDRATCKRCGEEIRYVGKDVHGRTEGAHWTHVSNKMAFKSEREGAHRPEKA